MSWPAKGDDNGRGEVDWQPLALWGGGGGQSGMDCSESWEEVAVSEGW